SSSYFHFSSISGSVAEVSYAVQLKALNIDRSLVQNSVLGSLMVSSVRKYRTTPQICPWKNLYLLSVRNCFIRGSVVRYVLLPQDGVDIDILHDATRREARGG
ncbi:unnamed protein product, partial [Urochloa humidicola]